MELTREIDAVRTAPGRTPTPPNLVIRSLPGIALCAAVAGAGYALQLVEERLTGHSFVEALVLAILLGAAIRTVWTPPPRFKTGVGISAKLLLEIAVVLLGASISLQTVAAAGPWLLAAIAAVVAAALATGYGMSRALGLPPRMAVLVACGNSICGNSAIAAVAPVIGAHADDIASSIAFTAILGVVVVLCLPLLVPVLGLSHYGYGVLAGMTVYAVPQVLAATAPVGALSVQVGTLVKLVRVLMLGPVVLGLSLVVGRINRPDRAENWNAPVTGRKRPSPGKLVPWFIIGFIVLAAFRSAGLIPDMVRGPIAVAATVLTVISMAALGLGVDVRVLGRVGFRATAAVTASLLLLLGLSLATIRLLGVA